MNGMASSGAIAGFTLFLTGLVISVITGMSFVTGLLSGPVITVLQSYYLGFLLAVFLMLIGLLFSPFSNSMH